MALNLEFGSGVLGLALNLGPSSKIWGSSGFRVELSEFGVGSEFGVQLS